MLRLVQYLSNRFEKFRFFKFNISKSNTQEVRAVAPFGVDSVPIKDMITVLGETKIKGKGVILGVLNTDGEADEGEVRLFSVDSSGAVKAKIHIKNDGTISVESENMDILATTLAIDGDVTVTGDIIAKGEVTAKEDTTNVSLSTHVHSTSGYGAPTSTPAPGT